MTGTCLECLQSKLLCISSTHKASRTACNKGLGLYASLSLPWLKALTHWQQPSLVVGVLQSWFGAYWTVRLETPPLHLTLQALQSPTCQMDPEHVAAPPVQDRDSCVPAPHLYPSVMSLPDVNKLLMSK